MRAIFFFFFFAWVAVLQSQGKWESFSSSDKIRNMQGGVAADKGGLSSTVDDSCPPTADGGVTYW